MKKPAAILSLILLSFSMTGTPCHPLNRNQSYQTFKNIALPIDANLVNVIFQDNAGLIWFGTQRGLFSYNGYDLHEYTDPDFPNGNPVFAIVQYSDDSLCLGTDNGVRWFNLDDKTMGCPYQETDLSLAVRSLALYDGYLWIGTRDRGLERMYVSTGKPEAVELKDGAETIIYSLEQIEDRLFIASYEHLSCYDGKTDERYLIDLGVPERLMVNSLLWDKNRNCLWVGTEGYLFEYDIKENTARKTELLTGNSFKSLALDSDGNLLIGTDAGLFVYDFASKSPTQVVHDSRNPKSLCNNVIWDILRDKNDNIWFATGRGVSVSHTNVGQEYIHLSEIVQSGDGNLFTCMLMDSSGGYWLGGDNGLIHIDSSAPYEVEWFRQDSEEHMLRHNHIRCIYEDSLNGIWIASDGGVARYEPATDSFVYYQIQLADSGRNANWAYSILEDRKGRMWIASFLGGIFVCSKDNLDILYNFGEDSGIGSNAYILNDGGDCIWANTSGGVVSIDIDTMQVIRHGIYADNILYYDGALWNTIYGELYRYDPRSGVNSRIAFAESCRQIHYFVNENGRIWFSSSEGIFIIDPQTSDISTVSYTLDNYLCGLYDEKNNVIVWGGEDCFSRIDAGKNNSASASKVYITSLVSEGRLLKSNEDYTLSSERLDIKRKSDIVIELSTLSYLADESLYYRFGDEESWQPLGKGNNHISLVNLPGGKYSLQLSNSNPASNPDAIFNSYSIVIPYPWYLRWQSFVLYFVFLVGIAVVCARIVHIRNIRKFELREKERNLELSNMKMDFFVNISHELKTPLSLIIAPVSKMLSETTNAKQRETLTTVYNNALRLNTLIHKVLDFKTLEAESEDILIRSHTELCALLKNCINTFRTVIDEKRISVNLLCPEEPVWANVDSLKLESAVINLISNSIKYVSEDSGIVDVKLDRVNDSALITISDNGCGINKEELSLVFIRYFQGKQGNRSEGSGIGLYLVKKYIELHGGHISIESRNGTFVKFNIPLVGENSCVMDEASKDEISSTVYSARILIIDDNKEMVAFLAETLSRDYECLKAYNGKEGLDVIGRIVPDLIIVDQMMPQMDGFSFSRAVRKNYHTATVPIIMLTAKEDMATEMESIKIGIDFFMPKPFDIKKLQLRIAQLLRKKESMEEAVRIEASSNPDFSECREQLSSDELFMEKVTKAIEENMGREDFNVSSLAGIISVDDKQLYRKLKQLTGSSPVNYIRKLRMRKASILLAEDKFSISEVMFLVGYSNASYFSKCFAQEYGMSPKEYRRSKDTRDV
ncbi:MAG: two-component regulator propeller domain-containing protein [Candidatus Cryptobacteroides sp.]